MNGDENLVIEKVTSLLDAKKTGAIPRETMNYSSHWVPSFYWDVIEKINSGQRVCVILRGLPGSGKSFLGRKIIEDTIQKNHEEHIISADDYFYRNGRYQYDISKLSEAHLTTQRLFFNRSSKGYSPLIVDNTNMQQWEMFPYIQAAIQYSYHLEIWEPHTPWKWSPNVLSQKNKHNVPIEKIRKMMDNYEKVTSVKDFIKNTLNLDVVKEPLVRCIPSFNSKSTSLNPASSEIDLIDFSYDENRNQETDVTQKQQKEPLSWQKFNSDLQSQGISNYFTWNQPKKTETEVLNNCTTPPQIFDDRWDLPNEKEISIKNKERTELDEIKPQPQRKQRKNKKQNPSSSPSSDSPEQLKPHRRYCPNENQSFAQLRELYPHIRDNYLWDFFEKCKGDAEWCADMLFDENISEQNMDTGEDLMCNCFSSDTETSIKKIVSGNITNVNKKATPVKAKKSKSNIDELLAAKTAIEENIRIGDEFYPEHVNKVKIWKGVSSQVPQSILETNLNMANEEIETKEEETLVALTINDDFINELNELFGNGRNILEQAKIFKTKMFIKSSTAKQLYREILETFDSHQEEARLQEIKNDRNFAMMLHEQEKAFKYPTLVQESSGDNFKDIMDTQAALKEYEEDVGEWNTVQKPNTIAEKLSKEKIYRVFSDVDRIIVDEIFQAQNRDFKKTIEIIQDSLGYTDEQRKEVRNQIENTIKFNADVVEETIEDDFTPEEYACIKRVEQLQEQFDHHSEEQMRCIQKSREHISKKDYHTASYYTSMVDLHKRLCEEKRQELMNILAFSFLNDATSTRLDLHYFTQEGAKTRLHTFLDAHIAKLREIKKQYIELEIITGRGAHSARGPVLKNMSINLFQERGLRYSEGNPGLLKVKVFPKSMLYEERQRLMKTEN